MEMYLKKLYVEIGNKTIIENTKDGYMIHTEGTSLYPFSTILPLIRKDVGCIALIDINMITIFNNRTDIYFKIIRNLEITSSVSKEYYSIYTKLKKQGDVQNAKSI